MVVRKAVFDNPCILENIADQLEDLRDFLHFASVSKSFENAVISSEFDGRMFRLAPKEDQNLVEIKVITPETANQFQIHPVLYSLGLRFLPSGALYTNQYEMQIHNVKFGHIARKWLAADHSAIWPPVQKITIDMARLNFLGDIQDVGLISDVPTGVRVGGLLEGIFELLGRAKVVRKKVKYWNRVNSFLKSGFADPVTLATFLFNPKENDSGSSKAFTQEEA